MKTPIRTIHVAQDAMERFRSDIQAEDDEFIGKIIAALLTRLALNRTRAWAEVFRVANINEETEVCRLSFISNEILVYEKTEEAE